MSDRSVVAGTIPISVIIPAHNAAATLAQTLDSLLAQSCGDWEAIVVDDGSTDNTFRIAAEYAERDPRIQVLHQSQKGEGGARNAGLAVARGDWLLFLDADDWISSPYLERMIAAAADPALGAVHCGWILYGPNGRSLGEARCEEAGDLFPSLARASLFPVHACIVLRMLVERVGGFDPNLRIGADWDLWQRIARLGTRFGRVDEYLAFYRLRPRATWTGNPEAYLQAGLPLIDRGHAADPRVAGLDTVHPHGHPDTDRARARLYFVCWPAGFALGLGEDPSPLLNHLEERDRDPDLDPQQVAHTLFSAVLLPTCQRPDAWLTMWESVHGRLTSFLVALEEQAAARGLMRRARTELERLVIKAAHEPLPITVGATHAIRIEVTEPIPLVRPPAGTERLRCEIFAEGEALGVLELPVCSDRVPPGILADAIAAEHTWRLLKRFFEPTLYLGFELREDGGCISVLREGVLLAAGLSPALNGLPAELHERIGWTVFLQELWGRPNWPHERFYEASAPEDAPQLLCNDPWLETEASDPIPDVIVPAASTLEVLLTVGGAPVVASPIPASEGVVRAAALRAAMCSAAGYEACRVAVREAILGRSFHPSRGSLRERLAAAAQEKRMVRAALPDYRPSRPTVLFPGWERTLAAAHRQAAPTMVVARRSPGTAGTGASRRAVLPADARWELGDAVATAGELALFAPSTAPEGMEVVVYAPEVVPRLPQTPPPTARPGRSGLAGRLTSAASGIEGLLQRRPRSGREPQPGVTTQRLPILMYHRIAPRGASSTARYRVAPATFEAQLRYLAEAGYHTVSLDAWRRASERSDPLSGRAVVLTFDDGYRDFAIHAWPYLRRYGFSAIVFVVSSYIGESNGWDSVYGESLPLLDWRTIRRLHEQGVEFGSHTATHPRLTGLSPTELTRELARSRAELQRGLGTPITAVAYPHGAEDEVVQHLAGGCGYTFGLTCRSGRSHFQHPLLVLPRIEITGSDGLEEFIAKVEEGAG